MTVAWHPRSGSWLWECSGCGNEAFVRPGCEETAFQFGWALLHECIQTRVFCPDCASALGLPSGESSPECCAAGVPCITVLEDAA